MTKTTKKMTTKEAKKIVVDALKNDKVKIDMVIKYAKQTYGKKWFCEWCDLKGVQQYSNVELRKNVKEIYNSIIGL